MRKQSIHHAHKTLLGVVHTTGDHNSGTIVVRAHSLKDPLGIHPFAVSTALGIGTCTEKKVTEISARPLNLKRPTDLAPYIYRCTHLVRTGCTDMRCSQ